MPVVDHTPIARAARPTLSNLSIAQAARLREIGDVADSAGLSSKDYEPLGHHKAKLTMDTVRRLCASQRKGKLILVTAITPTPAGEGKTTVTVGLAQGLQRLRKKAIPAIREPALGPIFGVKGGACGGGYSQVLPMEDINLFFTGDFPAITTAHNLISAVLDAHLHHGNALRIDTRSDLWPRTLDMNDRALREIIIGLGGKSNGVMRQDSFVITPASEVMAVFCLSTSIANLKQRLGNIVVAHNQAAEPVCARSLHADGATTALLASALRPNLVQTIEGGAAFVHGGPFGNIAHGCSSVLATKCALGLADYAVTEAGFGSDLGAEKFLDIVTAQIDHAPSVIVLVATIRALQHHGEGSLEKGFPNLLRHIQHLRAYGPPIIVAINRRKDDDPADHAWLVRECKSIGVVAITADPWNEGGVGCEALAEQVAEMAEAKSQFEPLYTAAGTAIEKLEAIVKKAYGGAGVKLSDRARKDLDWIENHGFATLPVCVAKTQYSLSDDASLLCAPKNFTVHVRRIRLSAGAGFLVAVCGDIMLMPGLGKTPTAFQIDVDETGKISGLF